MAVTRDPDLHDNEQGTRFFFGKPYHWTRPAGRHTPLVLAKGISPYEETHVQTHALLTGLQTLAPGEKVQVVHGDKTVIGSIARVSDDGTSEVTFEEAPA